MHGQAIALENQALKMGLLLRALRFLPTVPLPGRGITPKQAWADLASKYAYFVVTNSEKICRKQNLKRIFASTYLQLHRYAL